MHFCKYTLRCILFLFYRPSGTFLVGWHIYRDLEENIGFEWEKYIDRRANVHSVVWKPSCWRLRDVWLSAANLEAEQAQVITD
jgi:hypothetical protein